LKSLCINADWLNKKYYRIGSEEYKKLIDNNKSINKKESLSSESLNFKKPGESNIFVFTTKRKILWDSSGETKIQTNQ
jgi:hypothetical protein